MIPRDSYKTDKSGYEVDEKRYRRFSVSRQAFTTLGKKDTGQIDMYLSLEKMFLRMAEHIQKKVTGKTQIDYALDNGANAMNLLLGTYGMPNSQFLQWAPLFVPEFMQHQKVDISSDELTRQVKEAAVLYGSDLVGITMLDRKWVYDSDLFKPFVFEEVEVPEERKDAYVIPNSVNRVIVMALAMKESFIQTSPKVLASTAASLSYSGMGITVVSLAEYIRSLGYIAIPCMNDTALSVPQAIDAGLGELGRHGLLMTPEFGPNVRLCKVLTDMPLLTDSPVNFGMRAFCEQCLACARACPSGAICSGDRSFEGVCENNNSGVKKWFIKAEECLKFWQKNGTSCANCISLCPYTKGFLSEQCMECERCEIIDGGCSLQVTTHLRYNHGYLENKGWGHPSIILRQPGTGF
ncbi:reductive dehalogenase [Candidatus Contubernalis alkaliaceticus]|uniref:reductive dehalogenase n=1 Tax=Candidatus Contubernalis alkaliaceticus TaxID=338645 RepID=UPI001F4C252A|nr:reductive dehalogenase [Candidatus Contubernalis alkalaceticus]UNC91476.1 reductive dehalogenase [Candidatus Contubernalis alkalaceticus]